MMSWSISILCRDPDALDEFLQNEERQQQLNLLNEDAESQQVNQNQQTNVLLGKLMYFSPIKYFEDNSCSINPFIRSSKLFKSHIVKPLQTALMTS